MTFRFDIHRRADAVVLAPFGDLDVRSAGPLRAALDDLAAEDTRHPVVLDLAGSDFLDSSALGVLVGTLKQLEAAGRRLAVVSTKPHLVKILHITRLSDVIPVGDSIEAVLR